MDISQERISERTWSSRSIVLKRQVVKKIRDGVMDILQERILKRTGELLVEDPRFASHERDRCSCAVVSSGGHQAMHRGGHRGARTPDPGPDLASCKNTSLNELWGRSVNFSILTSW